MDFKQLAKFLETLLWYSLLAVLILSALAYFFVFIINWEDWFFGTKLDGLSAGIYLLAKAVISIILAGLLVHFGKYKNVLILMAVAYFGFLLFDSAATIQKNTSGRDSFSILLLVVFLIPGILFIVTLFTDKFRKTQKHTAAGQDIEQLRMGLYSKDVK